MDKFLKKNYKIIILVLFVLFFFKSMQSCLRKEAIERTERNLIEEKDSIITSKDNTEKILYDSIDGLEDSILFLSSQIKLYKSMASEAEKRAVAVQSAAEKIRSNTTIQVDDRRDSLKQDSILKNK